MVVGCGSECTSRSVRTPRSTLGPALIMEPGRVRHALLLLLLLLGSSPLGPQDVAAATSAAPKSARRQRAEVELRQAFLDLQVPVQGAPPPKLSHASHASPWGSPSPSSANHTPPVGLAVKLEDWGLFATLSSLATAILHAVGSERTLCLKSARPGKRVMNSWPYYPSAEFETKHGCTSYRCYLALASKVDLFPRGCGAVWRKARRKTATKAINVVNNEFECATHFPALERFGVPVSELREIVVMWLFEPTAPVKAYVDRRRQQTAWPWPWPWPRSGSDEVALPGHASPHGYAAVHVRWGDKLNTETVGRALTAEHYVNAARGVMRATKTATLFLATTSPRAVVEIRRGLNPPNESLVVPTISTRLDDSKAKEARYLWINDTVSPEENLLAVWADMSDMIDARGAVCTYSSNMGQWLFYHTAERRRRGEYALVGLDQPIEMWHYRECTGVTKWDSSDLA